MDQQRLLDLGRVEQAALALGRDLRVVGEHDRGAEHGVVLRRGEHRPRVDLLAARGLERRDEAAARRPARPRASRAASAAAPRRGRAPRAPSVWFSTRIVMRPSAKRERGASRAGRRSRTSTVARAGRSTRRALASWRTPAGLQEVHLPRHRGAVEHRHWICSTSNVAPLPARIRGRVDDPERRRRRVLRRARRVRVERVALVQQRVHERVKHRAAPPRRRRTTAARRRLALLQPVQRRGLQPHPAAAGVVERHHPLPVLDRELVARGAAPRDHRDLHVALLGEQDRPREVERQRDLAVGQRVEVLGRRQLEVVGARHGQREVGRALERAAPARRPASTGTSASSTPSARAARTARRSRARVASS